MMSCHMCKSTERKRGDFWYFVHYCFKINSTSFQLYTIFSNFTKNVPILLDCWVIEGSSVKGVSQRQHINECKRVEISIDYQCATKSRSAWKQSLIVRYVFLAEFNVKTDELPWAGWMELVGRIWPTGRTLPTPGLHCSNLEISPSWRCHLIS